MRTKILKFMFRDFLMPFLSVPPRGGGVGMRIFDIDFSILVIQYFFRV